MFRGLNQSVNRRDKLINSAKRHKPINFKLSSRFRLAKLELPILQIEGGKTRMAADMRSIQGARWRRAAKTPGVTADLGSDAFSVVSFVLAFRERLKMRHSESALRGTYASATGLTLMKRRPSLPTVKTTVPSTSA